MSLRDVIAEIRRQADLNQQEFAAAVGMDPTVMSRLGCRWHEHWHVFLKILEICDELGIDPREPAKKVRAVK